MSLDDDVRAPCPEWADRAHHFTLMRDQRRDRKHESELVQTNDPMEATHKFCACGLVVPRR